MSGTEKGGAKGLKRIAAARRTQLRFHIHLLAAALAVPREGVGGVEHLFIAFVSSLLLW